MAISAIDWAVPGTALLLVLCALFSWWRASSIRSDLLARDLAKSISFGTPQEDLRLSDVIKEFREAYGGDFVVFPEKQTASNVDLVFRAKVGESVQRGHSFRLWLDTPVDGLPLFLRTREYMAISRPIESLARDVKPFDIDEVIIKDQHYVYFAGLSIGRMKIYKTFAGTVDVRACQIQILRIGETDTETSGADSSIEGTLQIDTCRIAELVLNAHACRNLFLSNTSVGRLHCSGGHPFAGVVLITGRVTLHYSPSKMDAQVLASYSNLRAHLSASSQETSAMIVRSAELRALRKHETWFVWAVSLLYDLTSDYGNRPQLACLTLLVLFGINLLIISRLDAPVVTADCNGKLAATWIGFLCDGDWTSEVAAELLLAAEPLLNPFGILSAYPVEAGKPWVALWLWFARVFSILLVGLIFIGIRRRIRL